MSALSETVIKKFCELCDWAFQAWQTRKHPFDANPAPELLNDPRHRDFFVRLANMAQEYWLLQLVKLHDPPVQSGQINLTVDYVVSFGGWDEETRTAARAERPDGRAGADDQGSEAQNSLSQ